MLTNFYKWVAQVFVLNAHLSIPFPSPFRYEVDPTISLIILN